MSEKTKTSVMMPKQLLLQIDEARGLMGVGKNAFLSLGACMLLVTMARLKGSVRKRHQYLAEVNREFQKIMQKALEDA